ncbi:MAG: hypothetical protein WD267_03785 [Balneolales bacterium]
MGWIAGSSHGYNSSIRMSNPGQTRRSAPTFMDDAIERHPHHPRPERQDIPGTRISNHNHRPSFLSAPHAQRSAPFFYHS